MKIQQEWVEWAKDQIRMLKDGAHLIIPNGVIFKLDKTKKTLTTLCEHSSWNGSTTQKINRQTFAVIGWTVVRDESKISKDFDVFLRKIMNKGGSAMVQDLDLGVAAVVELPRPNPMNDLKKQMNDYADPVNPITLRGTPNLSIGRLWLQSNEISGGQHAFSSMKNVKRTNQEKTMQFVFWKDAANPLGYMIISDETKFIEGIWFIKERNGAGVTLDGVHSKKEAVASQISFSRSGDKVIAKMGDIQSEFDWEHFYKGLKHLFPNGELINPLAN